MVTVAAVVEHLERFAPRKLAAEWDNVGLLLGDRATPVTKIMTCLTVTPECAAEAIEDGAGMIVTHHPVLFRPIKRLTADNPEGRMLLALIKAGVAVYSPHTAFDNTKDGINDSLGAKLGLVDVRPLRKSAAPAQCKIVVFVPDSDLAKVSDALFAAGAGHIGQYSECSFRLAGTGTFFGSPSSNPTVGKRGHREDVSEWRLEAICPEAIVERVIAAVRKAHSYEEPAYDVYPLRAGTSAFGEGRLGKLPQPTPLAELARTLKEQLKSGPIQVIGTLKYAVQTVAIVCGAGGELLSDAIRERADVFLTGELRFHDYLRAQAQDISLILPGHYATERPAVEDLAVTLQAQWPELEVWASRKECDPVNWI